MPTYKFDMSLSTQEVRSIYEGHTRFIIVQCLNGLRLQLPSINFRRFVTPDGIQGRFSVTIDAHNKIVELRRLSI